jgi:glycyl-tRNA synthetase beta subunit
MCPSHPRKSVPINNINVITEVERCPKEANITNLKTAVDKFVDKVHITDNEKQIRCNRGNQDYDAQFSHETSTT